MAPTRIILLWSLCLLACGGPKEAGPAPAAPAAPEPQAAPTPPPPKEEQLVVFAAASLREAFTTLSDAFKASNNGIEVTLNFAGTQELRTQLEQGAQADVFASADQKQMSELLQAGRVKEPSLFARNEPVIVVAAESAKKVKSLADLPKLKKLVIGAPEVPIGRYTLQILDLAAKQLGEKFPEQVLANVVSRELNVRQVLAKVSLGEADAGIVYRTDTLSILGGNDTGKEVAAQNQAVSPQKDGPPAKLKDGKDKIRVVDIPADINVIAEYPIAVVANAPHPALAAAWVKLVKSELGQKALQDAGFLPRIAGAARSGDANAQTGSAPTASSASPASKAHAHSVNPPSGNPTSANPNARAQSANPPSGNPPAATSNAHAPTGNASAAAPAK